MRPEQQRFWSKVREDRFGCLVWTGGKKPLGYGTFTFGGRTYLPHRLVWEWVNGPIPEGRVIDHLCRNRLCVKISHLEVVTQQENILRGNGATAPHARATHCPQGHPYSPENTEIRRGRRQCRECKRELNRAYLRRRRERLPCSK